MAQNVNNPFHSWQINVKGENEVFWKSIAHSMPGTLNWAILNSFNISYKFITVNIDLNTL